MARRNTHSWAQELSPRFALTLEEGQFEWFTERGETIDASGKTYWFVDGCIRITKEGRRITFYSHYLHSEASLLIQAGEIVVAEFRLSHDLEVLVKHHRERGSQIPAATRNTAVAMIVWPETKRGWAKAILEGFPSGRSGVVEIIDDYRPRLVAPEQFCVMFTHRRLMDRRSVPLLPQANIQELWTDHQVARVEPTTEPNPSQVREKLLAKIMMGTRRTVMDRATSTLVLSDSPNERATLATSSLTIAEMGHDENDNTNHGEIEKTNSNDTENANIDEAADGAQSLALQEMSFSTEMLHAMIPDENAKQHWLEHYATQMRRLQELRFDGTDS